MGGAWRGPFSPVYGNSSLTLDFHAIIARLQAQGVACRSTPHGPVDGAVNTVHGGRIVCWSEPDGHVWEVLTQRDARQPAAA